ncbi:hypothetical protein MTO96_024151 [Rhipicephalus appendiculatus]
MNLNSLYAKVCRKVFLLKPNDHDAWAEIYHLLLQLRPKLSCNVCSKLPVVPMSSAKCRHIVCKGCVGQTMQLSEPCVDCSNDTSGYSEDAQLDIVLQCYRHMCRQLSEPRFRGNWGILDDDANTNFRNMVVEGSCLGNNRCQRPEQASTSSPSPSCVASTSTATLESRVVNRTPAAVAATKGVKCDATRRVVLSAGDAMALAHDLANSSPYQLIEVSTGIIKGTEGSPVVAVDTPDGSTSHHLDQIGWRVPLSPVAPKAEAADLVLPCSDNGKQQASAKEERLSPVTPVPKDVHCYSFNNAANISSSLRGCPTSTGLTKVYPTAKTDAKTVALKETKR